MISPAIPLYHWSPRARRASILRRGLEPGHWDREHVWRPPYVAYADNPGTAWRLSGGMPGARGSGTWDLWRGESGDVAGLEILSYDDGHPKEYRVYERIAKSKLWWVGQRDA